MRISDCYDQTSPMDCRNMYLNVNFRWPVLMGNNSTQNCSNSALPNSAFKPGQTPIGGGAGFSSSAANCVRDSPVMTSPSTSQHLPSNVATASPYHHPSLTSHHAPPPPHPAAVPPLCPPYPGTMEDRLGASTSSLLKDPCSPGVAHPAFPVSMPLWLQQQQQQSYNLSHLQQVLNHEKALLATAPYLTDPFNKAPLLDLARMGHYPLGKKLFGCPQCRYITDRKNNLKRHVATMHQECDKTLECCGVLFKNKASLRDHVLIFHSNGYMCRFCGRNFCRKALLKRHLTVHSGQKDYICNLCDYATSHKSNLERHKKVHERQGTDDEETNSKEPDSSSAVSSSDANSVSHNVASPSKTPSLSGSDIGPISGHPTGGLSLDSRQPLSMRLPPLASAHHGTGLTPTSSLSNETLLDEDLQLSPIDVGDEDTTGLIDVVELAN